MPRYRSARAWNSGILRSARRWAPRGMVPEAARLREAPPTRRADAGGRRRARGGWCGGVGAVGAPLAAAGHGARGGGAQVGLAEAGGRRGVAGALVEGGEPL